MEEEKIKVVGIVYGSDAVRSARYAKELGASMIEVRIDLFEDIKDIKEVLKSIKEDVNLPIIGTVRMEGERGVEFGLRFGEEERFGIYQDILPFVDLVDIEYKSGIVKKVVKYAQLHDKLSIVSYHNFKKTPAIGYMSKLARRIKKILKANIVKIATNSRDKKEFFRLLDFTRRCRYKPIASMAVDASFGKISRILCPLYGSCLVYGFVEDKKNKGLFPPGVVNLEKLINDLQYYNIIRSIC